MVEEGFSVQGQAGCRGIASFSSAAVRKGACRDVGRRVSEPQPEDFPGIRKSGEGVLWFFSLLGLRVSLLCYLGQAVTLG